LIISGEMDHTVPPALVNAAYKQQQGNEGVTEFVEIENRGHGLRSRIAVTASPSTAAGAKSPTPPSPSSNDSHSRQEPIHRDIG
jgi:hypothetical protein